MSSSLVGKLETDVEIKAPASKFHEIFKHKPHHISNVSSDFIQGCELHEGEWGAVGSVVYWKYFHDGKPRVAKELVEAIDDENNSITFKILEGDLLEHFKSFKVTLQSIPKGEGSVIHWTLEYEKLHDEIIDPHTLIQFVSDLSKDLQKSLVEA
ncbi:MLP-like protein 43 [Ziziphus jujuba]|uniref:MLP-like protein 43 n=1 Tax=Ziziphus jujuba TaxID=326968 RepID=A0ABM3I1N0_ZIZJJ|nr:MLP-like protein 43 [Ziziphus jujuba]